MQWLRRRSLRAVAAADQAALVHPLLAEELMRLRSQEVVDDKDERERAREGLQNLEAELVLLSGGAYRRRHSMPNDDKGT